ncbi:type I restriction enzyme, S subunit [Epilithonimonas bovis DSM 19482]|uniref:Type I restriction enzyme, S subunit n=1 Tax=Epilithonimonas bovis DSM 19482 TaxID=1121284 RepID=A0A1U7Q1F2_9FLAO|nr:restriction endonuclease subunit S [Epilithonimonas bovis]SIT98943.1 type I restriction enzyme, S subunit [Epilithonimonas bovis DSM 19482]
MEYWESEIKLSDLMNKGIISLGRGRIISSIDLQKKPGVYPVYSSSSQKGGLFGLYDEFDFDEELLTWSVDGGGHFFYRPKHKFSVTNVSGILKINEPIFDYKFLYYSLVYQHSKEVFDYVDKAHPSVIKKRYNVPNISINEQKKIAEILTKVDEAIENTEKLIQKYERVKVGLMQDLLTKGIDDNGNIRSEETHQFKDSPLGRIPVEWDFIEIEKLINKNTSISYGIVQTFENVENGVPVLRTLDLKENSINDLNNLLRTKKSIADRYKKTYLKAGDIVVNVRASVGDFNVIPIELEGINITRGVARISLRDEFNPNFYTYFFNSEVNMNNMLDLIKGTTFIDINMKDLRKLLVPILDFNEQDRISFYISKQIQLIKNEKVILNYEYP